MKNIITSRVTRVDSNQPKEIRNIILVSSGKDGVEKSTIASNLALSLASKGTKLDFWMHTFTNHPYPLCLVLRVQQS